MRALRMLSFFYSRKKSCLFVNSKQTKHIIWLKLNMHTCIHPDLDAFQMSHSHQSIAVEFRKVKVAEGTDDSRTTITSSCRDLVEASHTFELSWCSLSKPPRWAAATLCSVASVVSTSSTRRAWAST